MSFVYIMAVYEYTIKEKSYFLLSAYVFRTRTFANIVKKYSL